ncbi:regulatory protein RecX [Butyrivibrio sp. NC2002]|uniref:regulatory protein RecX n=1 Tax=Butyrivibrio sp. NC2002 TaxID=1410610 RepID=UPI000566DFE4|nr:regulatory protein RecX [Butyrivibrio sp. NC2002]
MIVTDIVPFDNKRSKIFIDGEFAFILYKGEIRELHLKTGEEISSPVFSEIMEQVLPKRAKLRAMNLLQKRDYTEYKLRQKLKEGEYPAEIIDEAIDYLKGMRYLDDNRYATDYISYHMNIRSKNRIKQDLISKGISNEIIESAFEDCYSEIDENPEIQMCIKLLQKKKYDPDTTTFEENQKLRAFLYRKGFGNDVIQKAMTEYEKCRLE